MASGRALASTRGATQPPIADYAVIGDCRSAALVSRAGSIDWLCWPRFDSPAVFAALLDWQQGGYFGITPRDVIAVRRCYLGDTAVLCTTFETASGRFELRDAMAISSAADRKQQLLPEHEIVRTLRCTGGEGVVDIDYRPRPDFARQSARLRDRGPLGLRVETRQGLLTMRSERALTLSDDGHGASATVTLNAVEDLHFSLSWSRESAAVLTPLGSGTAATLDRTAQRWQEWSARTRYEGPYRAAVVRSAIVVRLLSFAPSGAIVAAATTSLPEKRGGKNNWDYRYCWLRDAAFTVRGMLELGHAEEAQGFADWLLHATRLSQPRLKVLYDVYGRAPPKERSLEHLAGYQGAMPVHTGNGADGQVQLDSYGEVIDAVWRVVRAGRPLDRTAARVVEAFGRYVCKHWQDVDAGIWEPREAPQRHTHSLLLCWVALDRLIDLQANGSLRARHRPQFTAVRAEIAGTIRERGYDRRLQSYVDTLDGETLDATALLIGWYGFEPAGSTRLRMTCKALLAELSPQPGLLFRNKAADDDGAFGICCFWLAEHLAKGGGTLEEARASFEATLAFANDLGLFAEEIEPGTGAALGNLPQTFTHVGLINAALSIAEREKTERRHLEKPP